MLAEVTDLRIVTEVACALLVLHNARENLEQSGLSGAVRPDEHGAFAPFDLQVEVLINLCRAIGHVDALERRGPLPTPRRWRNLEAKRLARRQRLLDLFHALDLLELGHGLRGLRRHGTKAVGKFLERLDLLLLI